MIRLASAFVSLILASAASADPSSNIFQASSGFSCSKLDGKVVIKFGMTRRPTFFGIRTPDDQFVYVRYSPRDVDVLGKKYQAEPIVLDIRNLRGVKFKNDKAQAVLVFSLPGKYILRFQDATRAEYEDLFALSCTIDIERSEVVKPPSTPPTDGSAYAAPPGSLDLIETD